jgi:hypothetical protein
LVRPVPPSLRPTDFYYSPTRLDEDFVERTGRIAAQLRAAQDEDCVVGKSSLGKMVLTFP